MSTVAPWWPSDMTKALQQRWWYSSTTSLDYCWCTMNKSPITNSNYHVWPVPALKRTSPMLSLKISFSSPTSTPLLCFRPFLLNSGSLKLLMAIQKEGKTVEIERLEGGGGGRERTTVFLTPVLHIFELMRKKSLNGKEKRKKQDFLQPW